jgi:hypothetical protein
MRVFNLSPQEVTYKGRRIPPNGGSAEFPTLSFIPDRDLALQEARILSFGSLPKWWKVGQAIKATKPVVAVVAQPGTPNKNGDVFPEKTLVITTDAPVEAFDKVSMSMSSERKKK